MAAASVLTASTSTDSGEATGFASANRRRWV